MSIKGGRLHDSGDYEEAIKFCNNALKEHNHSVELYDIYRIRGKVYIDTQKYEEAIIDFKKCLKLVSENSLEGEYYSSGINIEIGIAYEEINEFDSALNYLQKVKKYAEQLEDVSERRIETYTRLGILY